MGKKTCKDNKGITLIVLVLTIALLLILTAVSVDIIIDGELFDKAKETVSQANNQSNTIKTEEENVINDDNYSPGKSVKTQTPGNNEPTIMKNELKTKTTNSIQLGVKAVDSDEEVLQYNVYISTSESGANITKKTYIMKENNEVEFNFTELTPYTMYWWYVTVSDGKTITASEKKQVRTYCPGTGNTCTTTYCSGMQYSVCTTCNGSKTVQRQCSGGGQYACSSCNGRGTVSCPGSPSETSRTYATCPRCGSGAFRNSIYSCSVCGVGGSSGGCDSCGYGAYSTNNHASSTITCSSCSGSGIIIYNCVHEQYNAHTYYANCTTCSGTGQIGTPPCQHGYSVEHRFCVHYSETTLVTHSYCNHGSLGEQHDN